jgi:manganese/zinc/iron transport system permease protein
MTAPQIEIQIIAVVVSTACAIPGTFLVLRKMAMISDAISHSILPGIVVGFFITQNISSPILVLFAALTGLLTVLLVESVNKTGLVKEDTAIGLVFPAMFSIGVILISRFAGDVHLDTHAVLVGELAFAPFDRLMVNGTDLGPKSLWVMGGILLLTLVLLFTFYKELKLSTFDAQLAASLGFTPVVIHYGLMTMTSITAVGAFDAVGAILVVALMIVPASAAYLITKSLKKMLLLSVGLGIAAAVSGYWAAHWVNASIGGSMATMLGIIFFLVFMFAPSTGMISVLMRRRRQKLEFAMLTFLLHLKNHQQKADSIEEQKVDHLTGHFRWSRSKADKVLHLAQKNNMIRMNDGLVELTEKGSSFTSEAMYYIITNKNLEPANIWGQFLIFR